MSFLISIYAYRTKQGDANWSTSFRKLAVGIEFAEYALRDQTFRKSFMICRNYSLIPACDERWIEPPRTGSPISIGIWQSRRRRECKITTFQHLQAYQAIEIVCNQKWTSLDNYPGHLL